MAETKRMMNRLLLSVALATGAAVDMMGQPPSIGVVQAYKRQFENERVRVTRVHYPPNATLGEHAHPGLPSLFVYLNDGPAIAFKHQHGDSGTYAATRPPTKAGGYRLAAGRNETHVVVNNTDQPSDFLQVEIKTPIDLKTFTGRRFRDASDTGTFARVEFENDQLRITRVGCVDATGCSASTVTPALVLAMTSGETQWVAGPPNNLLKPGEFLVIGFK